MMSWKLRIDSLAQQPQDFASISLKTCFTVLLFFFFFFFLTLSTAKTTIQTVCFCKEQGRATGILLLL